MANDYWNFLSVHDSAKCQLHVTSTKAWEWPQVEESAEVVDTRHCGEETFPPVGCSLGHVKMP